MATKRSILLERLAFARQKKSQRAVERAEIGEDRNSSSTNKTSLPLGGRHSPSKAVEGAVAHKDPPERETPADGQRELAKNCAVDAMVMGWDRAVQKHAYENQISEDEMKRILDSATEYNDKADPSGRIDELNDWKKEKQGRSSIAVRASRPS